MIERCVVVGAGHAGVQCTASLRQEGYAGEVILIDADTDLPYHKPPLSKGFLKSPDTPVLELRSASFYPDHNIETRFGTMVSAIDRSASQIVLESGERLDYSHLVLATGSSPIVPPLDGLPLNGVVVLRSLADAKALNARMTETQRVVIVGGGFIGLELAHTLKALGKAVTILEATGRILGRAVCSEISDYVRARTLSEGIDILLDTKAASFDGQGGKLTHVVTGAGESLPCDMVVLCIGARPSVALAEDAGLEIDGGISVDAAARTSDPNIFAIGDNANFPEWQSGVRLRLESVQNATDQAKAVAREITGHGAPYSDVAWFWSDQGDMKLQMAGIALGADRSVVAPVEGNAMVVYRFRGDLLVAVDTINKPMEHMLARKMIAAGITPSLNDIEGGPPRIKALLAAKGPAAAIR